MMSKKLITDMSDISEESFSKTTKSPKTSLMKSVKGSTKTIPKQ